MGHTPKLYTGPGGRTVTIPESDHTCDELLEACQMALGLITGGSLGIPSSEHAALEALKAAIDKATGR